AATHETLSDQSANVVFGCASFVKAAVAAKLGACEALEVQRYRTQVVAGTNFKVHAKVDGKDVIITAFRPLPHTGEALSVSDVVEGSDL
ncbi:unnamed protein product, partial [Symbiodinium sp. KB8]